MDGHECSPRKDVIHILMNLLEKVRQSQVVKRLLYNLDVVILWCVLHVFHLESFLCWGEKSSLNAFNGERKPEPPVKRNRSCRLLIYSYSFAVGWCIRYGIIRTHLRNIIPQVIPWHDSESQVLSESVRDIGIQSILVDIK